MIFLRITFVLLLLLLTGCITAHPDGYICPGARILPDIVTPDAEDIQVLRSAQKTCWNYYHGECLMKLVRMGPQRYQAICARENGK